MRGMLSCRPKQGTLGEGRVGKCWDYRLVNVVYDDQESNAFRAGSVPWRRMTRQL